MKLKLLQFVAMISTALYLVPTGAHLFEMPSKMALRQTEYMIVQRIYAGWSLFGMVIAVALASAMDEGLGPLG